MFKIYHLLSWSCVSSSEVKKMSICIAHYAKTSQGQALTFRPNVLALATKVQALTFRPNVLALATKVRP